MPLHRLERWFTRNPAPLVSLLALVYLLWGAEWLSALPQGVGDDSPIRALVDSAVAMLEAGDPRAARGMAERAVELAPNDPGALIALGRVHLSWPRIGRFAALKLFRRAARLEPDDPEAYYWIGRVGVELLGDDGEAIARPGLERALSLDPTYRDAWDLWLRLYRGPKDRTRMAALLVPHGAVLEVRARLAQLWLEDGDCRRADSLLARLESQAGDPRWPAWRAECAFVQGNDAEGSEHYARALAMAGRDTSDALWAQVASIARPDERVAYTATPPPARPAFYRAFWGPRDPNVRTAVNERIAEHFRRRAVARERFRLQHPLSLYHHSRDYRDYVSPSSSGERREYVAVQVERGTRIAEALISVPALTTGELLEATAWRPDEDDLEWAMSLVDEGPSEVAALSPEILPLGRNLPEMVDDRGLVYIRHGAPDRYDLRTLDAEEWAYESGPPLRLRFDRGWYPPDPPLPEMIHRPMTGRQGRSVALAMTSDRSSLPAPLEFGFWYARFRSQREQAGVDLLIFPEPNLAATGVLWDGAGLEIDRANAALDAWLQLSSPPGQPLLALDVERNDSLGRYRGLIELPDYRSPGVALSDLLIARDIRSAEVSREEAARRAIPSLAVGQEDGFLVYLEVYGLASQDGVHNFQVSYAFEREQGWLARLLGGADKVTLRYERVEERSDGAVIEAVGVEAGAVPPGRYELTVRVRDLLSGRTSSSRSVALRLLP